MLSRSGVSLARTELAAFGARDRALAASDRLRPAKSPAHSTRGRKGAVPTFPHGEVPQVVELSALILVIAACTWLAWSMRFVCDDAYISWRYSRNLVEGHGLNWNPGSAPVEGYTNFAWTLLSAIPLALGLDIEPAMKIVGITMFVASLVVFHGVVRGFAVGRWTSLAATAALGAFATFAFFATGGLETPLQALLCLIVAAFTLSARPLGPLRSMALGLTAALSLATRLDTVLLIAPLLVALVIRLHESEGRRGLLRLIPALSVLTLAIGAWFAWKLAYYGSVLPNTFRAKVTGDSFNLKSGLRYLWIFARSYLFMLPLVFAPIGVLRLLRGPDRTPARPIAAAMLLAVVGWVSYLAWIGGDNIEFRMLVPALPFVLALAFAGAHTTVSAVLLAASLFFGSYWHLHIDSAPLVPESIASLSKYEKTGHPWVEIGKRLRDAFPGRVQPSIAVTPAGMIPFYSRLPAVDMLGLNDEEVDRFLVLKRMVVGHQRLIPLSLLRERRVTFLIGHPALATREGMSSEDRFTYQEFTSPRLFLFPDESTLRGLDLIEVPLSRERVLLMVYLTPSPEVSARLTELGWRRYPLM